LSHPPRPVVHVRENLAGWWDVTVDDAGGLRQLAQYTSEFQAREAGRANAQRFEADLVIHQASGPSMYLTFDATTGTLIAAAERLPSD
jgi:hypothetical protein